MSMKAPAATGDDVQLNFIFFDESNPRKTSRCIVIPSSSFKDCAQDCRGLFLAMLLKEFKCDTDETRISFWKVSGILCSSFRTD